MAKSAKAGETLFLDLPSQEICDSGKQLDSRGRSEPASFQIVLSPGAFSLH